MRFSQPKNDTSSCGKRLFGQGNSVRQPQFSTYPFPFAYMVKKRDKYTNPPQGLSEQHEPRAGKGSKPIEPIEAKNVWEFNLLTLLLSRDQNPLFGIEIYAAYLSFELVRSK